MKNWRFVVVMVASLLASLLPVLIGVYFAYFAGN